MKTNAPLPRLLAAFACLLGALTAVSCQSSAIPSATNHPVKTDPSHWVRVSSQPPTYFPRGVPADAPTDHLSGQWVETEDDRGTRYFIPFRGLGGKDRQMLVNEALSARSERKLARIANEDLELQNRQVTQVAKHIPLMVAFTPITCMTGFYPTGEDVDRWTKEWYSTKGIER